MRLSLLFLLAYTIACGHAERLQANEDELASLVRRLGSDRFEVREAATLKLIDAGPDAIDVVADDIGQADVETSLRELQVLRELALQDNRHAIRAEEALTELAANRATAISQRAAQVLTSLHRARTSRGMRILKKLGASISFGGLTFEEKNLGANVIFVSFGDKWEGTVDDLGYLDWLADYRGIHVTLKGEKFGDPWLERLSSNKRLLGLQLNRVSVTNEGFVNVTRLDRLQTLSVRYCRLSNEILPHIEELRETLESVSVYGGNVTKPAFDSLAARLKKQNGEFRDRYGRGGFLGIGGSKSETVKGCLVSNVQANHAASRAGIRESDVITEYNGHKVTEFVPDPLEVSKDEEKGKPRAPSLSELIGQNKPGDKVKITIMRGSDPNRRREIVKEVVLGEWP